MKKLVALIATVGLLGALAFGFGVSAPKEEKAAETVKIEQPKADPPVGW